MSDRKVRRRRFGDRPDGRLLRTLDPLYCVTPYIMKKKSAASNMFSGTMDITETDRYIRARRKEGMPHLGILHFFIAVFVRTVSQYPAINRFIAGQKIYSRDNIPVNLSLKKEMTTDGQETTVKAYFDPADTMRDVYDKMQAMIDEGKQKGDANGTDKYARLFRFIPGLLLSLWCGFWSCWIISASCPRRCCMSAPSTAVCSSPIWGRSAFRPYIITCMISAIFPCLSASAPNGVKNSRTVREKRRSARCWTSPWCWMSAFAMASISPAPSVCCARCSKTPKCSTFRLKPWSKTWSKWHDKAGWRV